MTNTFTARYTCPSNIAIVKYWGKYGNQLPRNASISFTLTNAISDTTISIIPKKKDERPISFLFEGKEKISFLPKIQNFFDKIAHLVPFIKDFDFNIESNNSFPHSSGIASSASGMAAMAMCLVDIESQMIGKPIDIRKVSIMARLGSGSACRSLFPNMAVWGEHPSYIGSSNEYAIEVSEHLHDVFTNFHDDILIVSGKEKSVSSTAGHALMDTNVYASQRYKQANDNMTELKKILNEGDVHSFGKLAESEAMTLHALMMCSDPSYILIEPDTINVINQIRNFRSETGLPLYFTLDAGPNVHILYPHSIEKEAKAFIEGSLMKFSPQNLLIKDVVGKGAMKINLDL